MAITKTINFTLSSNSLMMRSTPIILLLFASLSGCEPGIKWTETGEGEIRTVTHRGGQTLGYSIASGVTILTVDGYGFKDLNKNGTLDPYEDWRLNAKERAVDLAGRMSVEQIAGLMLYSSHQSIPSGSQGFHVRYLRGPTL